MWKIIKLYLNDASRGKDHKLGVHMERGSMHTRWVLDIQLGIIGYVENAEFVFEGSYCSLIRKDIQDIEGGTDDFANQTYIRICVSKYP